MPKVGRYNNAALNLDWQPDALPQGTVVEPMVFPTADRNATSGLLFRPSGQTTTVVAITHPRVDVTGHYLIPPLLRAGVAVWAQRSRNVNNDLTTVHEQLLLDLAVAHTHLLDSRGFEKLFLLGNSGGASLYCLYIQQAALAPADRLTDTASGQPVDLTVPMPLPDGLILLAPHPGQGDLLLHCIDPAVVDESDPVATVQELDLFDPANGFWEPPESSHYADEFLTRYRRAQRARVERIDLRAREIIAEKQDLRRRSRESDDRALSRAQLAPAFMHVYRTDADPRTVSLELDPSDRDYGSIFGRRPDITNFGPIGFGRLTTPHAWLSTWSGISTRAAIRLTAPSITVPMLLIAYTADNSVFPEDAETIFTAFGSVDKQMDSVVGDHYGYTPGTEDRAGGRLAAARVVEWLGHQA